MTTAHQKHAGDLWDIKARQRVDDIHIATFAQHLEIVQDDAEHANAISKALATESEKRAKRYAWLAVLSSPIEGSGVPVGVGLPPASCW